MLSDAAHLSLKRTIKSSGDWKRVERRVWEDVRNRRKIEEKREQKSVNKVEDGVKKKTGTQNWSFET